MHRYFDAINSAPIKYLIIQKNNKYRRSSKTTWTVCYLQTKENIEQPAPEMSLCSNVYSSKLLAFNDLANKEQLN
jgi:hypothetical protein